MKAKRAFDIVGSLFGITVSAIPCVAAAFSLAVINRGSPFFVQERVGLNGKPFKLLKLKSIRDIFDGDRNLLPVEQRTSKLGVLLRKAKLDELPQFLNALKGDMSLVGPRPTIDINQPFGDPLSQDWKRHTVQPGMTGLAQLEGLTELSKEQILELDHRYVDHHSLFGDVAICIRTPFSIASKFRKPHYNTNNRDSIHGVVAKPMPHRDNSIA